MNTEEPVKQLNIQPPEKQTSESDWLDVVKIFPTIQGEGPFTGQRAIFIRLAGCNLQCPGCDTDYTTDRHTMHVSEIMDKLAWLVGEFKNTDQQLVVITGGEPFRQQIKPLVDLLCYSGYKVQIETNGTLPLPKGFNPLAHIVCSPKSGSIHHTIERRADAFKYVMEADSVDPIDGLPVLALQHSARPRVARPDYLARRRVVPIYLQPMDSQNEDKNRKNLEVVLASCMEHGYILQLQVHKYINVE